MTLATLQQAGGRARSLAIEGWRGINHSFALVNQHQILELLKLDGLQLFHRDLPFAFPHWTREANPSGLPEDQQRLIDAIAPPGDEPVDCVYRIGSPFRGGPAHQGCRTVTFMVTELGLTPKSFEDGVGNAAAFTRGGDAIVTPSRWSRDRLVEWGFPEAKVEVIPHGVDGTTFAPLAAGERLASRRALGIADGETVFLNVGLPTWNKGVDLLLAAFAALRGAGRRVRLILKDQRDLYGCSVEALIRSVGTHHPALLAADTLSAISVIPANLGTGELRTLFAVADCYASPYRAEGFNLPVLEAIACGTPVVATRGGATDDFCTDDVAVRIGGQPGRQTDAASGATLCHIEPNLGELIEAMDAVSAQDRRGSAPFEQGRLQILARFSWKNAAERLSRATTGRDGHETLDRDRTAPEPGDGDGAARPGAAPPRPSPTTHPGGALRRAPHPHRTALIHQIYITDDEFKHREIPHAFQRNQRALQDIYPDATLKMWNVETLREEIEKSFDRSVVAAFDTLQPYAFKADVGRLCLLYVHGGLYVDVGIRFVNALDPPAGVGIATFAGPWNGSPTWVAMTNGIIWSEPGRRELAIAIDHIVDNCRTRFYGENCLYPTGPVCLGRAFAAAMAEKIGTASVDDQWVGIQRSLTPEAENKNWCFVAPDATLVATSVKRYPSDLSHLGAKGTNSYFKIWSERNVYGERRASPPSR